MACFSKLFICRSAVEAAGVDGLADHYAILLIVSDGSGEYKINILSTLQDAPTDGILKVARKAMIIGENRKPYVERLDVPTQERNLECDQLVIEFLFLLVPAVWYSSTPGESIRKVVSD